jgi:hypothetical protein
MYPGSDAGEDAYWANFTFTNPAGGGHTYVASLSNYSGALPSQYPGLSTTNAPVWRILSNAERTGGYVVGTAQVDVLLATVPLDQYAIFYNGLLEFSDCAPMTVNGRVHCNTNIYVGSPSALTFNGAVTSTGPESAPAWDGYPTSDWTAAVTFNGGLTTNVPTVTLQIGSSTAYPIIQLPAAGETPASTATNSQGLLYYESPTVLLVSNGCVFMSIRTPPTDGSSLLPGADPSPSNIVVNFNPSNTSATNFTAISSNFPFLSITNSFTDQRQNNDTIVLTQIDVGKYATWLANNSVVQAKYPASQGQYAALLYVADCRTTSSSQMPGVRLTNGVSPPVNGGQGFSVATPDPLYVLGNYNCSNSTYLGTTNTIDTVPCAFMSDALTILSQNWEDSQSSSSYYSDRTACSTTVNAAILTGNVPSTGSTDTTYSGGVHNLPRLLEIWTGDTLTLNTALINVFASGIATNQFQKPGIYYEPPTRVFSFDPNFANPAKQPPGMPCALVPLRFGWCTPPPGTVTYYVSP